MRKLIALLGLVIFGAAVVCAQTTSVSGTVSDANGQAFAAGTWSAELIGPPGYTGNFYYNGAILGPTDTRKTGVFDASGNISVTVYSNNVVAISGGITNATQWQFTVCSAATSPCYTTSLNITGASYNVTGNINPPAIKVNGTGPNVVAYSDSEIVGAKVGFTYFNYTSATLRMCTVSIPCTWVAAGGGATPASPAASLQLANSTVTGLASITGLSVDSLSSPTMLQVPFSESIKGPSPRSDITNFGARAVSISGTASCNATTTITLSSAYPLIDGDGIYLPGCGVSSTLATPAAPIVTTGAPEGPTTPDIPISAVSGGASTYKYLLVARDRAGSLSAAGTAATITTGPSALGPQTCAVTSAALSNSTITFTLTSACSVPTGALVDYTGGTALRGRWVISHETSNTSISAGQWQATQRPVGVNLNSNIAGSLSSTGGTLTWMWGNHIALTPVSGSFETYICAERPGDANYHVVGVTAPSNSNSAAITTTWTDWGPTISAVPTLPPYVSDSICTNASTTPAPYSGTITAGAGTTSITVTPATSQTVSGQAIYQDSVPAINAAATLAAANGGVVFIPAGTFNLYAPLTISANVLQEGNISVHDTITRNGFTWTGHNYGATYPQFGWAGSPTITCTGADPCMYNATSTSVTQYVNLSASGNAALLFEIGNNAQGQDSLNYVGLSTGSSSDYDGIGLLILPGYTNYNFDHIDSLSGPNNGSSYIDTTWAPAMYFDAIGATNPVGNVHGKSINLYARPMFWAANGGSVTNVTLANVSMQGGLFPTLSIENFNGAVGLTGDLRRFSQDTSPESDLAYWQPFNGSGTPLGGIGGPITITGFLAPTSPGTVTTGTMIPGLNVVNGSAWASGEIDTGSANLFANDAIDSGSTNCCFQLRGFRRIEVPSIHLSGDFYPIGTPTLSTPTLSAGGSVPVGSHTYYVWAVDPDGAWGLPSASQSITVTTGNQTVNLSWTAVLGASGYVIRRDNAILGSTFGPITTATTYTDTSAAAPGLANLSLQGMPGGGQTGFSKTMVFAPKFYLESSDSASFAANFTGTFTANRADTVPDVAGTFGLITGTPTNTHCAELMNTSGVLSIQDSGATCGGGSGTVTDGTGSTTANQVALSTTTAHQIAYDANFTDNAGAVTAVSYTTSGTTAGLIGLTGSVTNPTIPGNSAGWLAPASATFTSWFGQLPSTAPSGGQTLSCGTPSANVSTCSWVTPLTSSSVNNLAKQTTNCAAAGSAANPSVVACSAAASGLFSCATNASTGTCTIDTTAVTANSVIQIEPDDSLGTALSVTCNTAMDTGLTAPRVGARVAGTSFTINLGTFSTNPECFSYIIVN
jgi:hypothetical protein